MNCSTCKFCKPVSESDGECRRNAPVLMPINDQLIWHFPGVNLTLCWCGEHQEKELDHA